jgi:hypothetical protein
MKRLIALLPILALGCGGTEEPVPGTNPPVAPPVAPPPGVVPPPVVHPTTVEEISLGLESRALPTELQSDPTLSIGALPSGVTIAGGAGGLFEIGSDSFTRISQSAVTSIARHQDAGLVVAAQDELFVFDGALRPSPIAEVLGTEKARSLAKHGADLWIGTDSGLWLYQDAELSRFEGMTGVFAIDTYDGASMLMVLEGSAHKALRVDGGAWSAQALDDEITLDRAAIGPGGRIFGVKDGALFERVKLEDKVVWRAVSFSIDMSSPGATGIEAAATDPSTGSLWIADASSLWRIETAEGRVSKVARPASLGRVITARVTADGALWLGDGSSLHRVGNAGAPVGWEAAIQPFAEANCLRCHASVGGVARPSLDTYEAWSSNIDRIIRALDEGRMPADRQPLRNGTVDLVKKWRDDGLRP